MICIVTRGARISMTDEDFTIALNFRLLPFIISGTSSGFARYRISRGIVRRRYRSRFASKCLCLCLARPYYYVYYLFIIYQPFPRIRAREDLASVSTSRWLYVPSAAGFHLVHWGKIQEFSDSVFISYSRARTRASPFENSCVLAPCSGICPLIRVLTLASLVIFYRNRAACKSRPCSAYVFLCLSYS